MQPVLFVWLLQGRSFVATETFLLPRRVPATKNRLLHLFEENVILTLIKQIFLLVCRFAYVDLFIKQTKTI